MKDFPSGSGAPIGIAAQPEASASQLPASTSWRNRISVACPKR